MSLFLENCLCVAKHVIHTIQTSKHEENNLLMDSSQQVLCTMQLLLNLKSYPYFVEARNVTLKNSIQAFEYQQVIGMWLPYEGTINFILSIISFAYVSI